MKSSKPLLIDGRTGEGGGQLVRLACALAALTSQPIRIVNVRGNRDRGTGLKAQHVSAIEWLARATEAEVVGLVVGSQTLEFRPMAPPTALSERKIIIEAATPGASALLIFQAVFPYLLFAGGSNEVSSRVGKPSEIELEIRGSTNASFSPSYEYLDQVMLPTLQERFGVAVERRLVRRAWTSGPPPAERGAIWLRFRPMPPGQTLKLVNPWSDGNPENESTRVVRIDVSILVPQAMRAAMETGMVELLGTAFPEADVRFVLSEDSGHDARMYVLAVAYSATGLRWGRDFLYDRGYKKKQVATIAREMARAVAKQLRKQIIDSPAAVDEHLQDQLVVFQALAEGTSAYWSQATETLLEETPDRDGQMVNRRDRTHQPFGFGSTHATTARWVASELLPTVQWFNNGTICQGAGFSLAGSSGTVNSP